MKKKISRDLAKKRKSTKKQGGNFSNPLAGKKTLTTRSL